MTDVFSKKKRSDIMRLIKSADSEIEIKFRKALWANGFRYRKNSINYFGKPDLLLAKYKTVVFIDSCFWHGCAQHGEIPKTRSAFWRKKIKRNRERDKNVNLHYAKIGWTVFRFWEHDIQINVDIAVKKVGDFLKVQADGTNKRIVL